MNIHLGLFSFLLSKFQSSSPTQSIIVGETHQQSAKMPDPMHPDLPEVAKKLIAEGPHKQEKTPRRVRTLFDGEYLFDTTSASHVWEHPYFPQIYIPTSAIKADQLTKTAAIDKDESVFSAKIKSPNKETDRVLVFEKGVLAGLTRVEFSAMGVYYFLS